jgi:predicted dehydrogenase
MRRRTFFHLSAAGALASTFSSCSKSAADVRIAVIGVRSRGRQLIDDGIRKNKGGVLVAICDVDQRELDKAAENLAKEKITVTKYTDYRKLLESKDVDAVIIATPNHTHTLLAMSALAAGKHVYVEKPVCHNIWEGQQLMAAAAKRPNLILQHGMQRRSNGGWAQAMKYLEAGKLGKVLLTTGINYKPRVSIGGRSEKKIHKDIDSNLWFGPRTPKAVTREKFHYDWHWFWEYGNGDIGNQGPHQFDVGMWSLGDPKLPTSIQSIGQRWGYEDAGETPNQQLAFFKGAGATLLFDNRGLPAKAGSTEEYKFRDKFPIGNYIQCEQGYIAEKYAYDNSGKELEKFAFDDDTANHMGNFIKSVQAGKALNDNLLIQKGFQAAALAHLANISYRVGQSLGVDAVKEQIKGDMDATASFEDMLKNLAANNVDLAAKPPVLGAALTFDPDAFKFTGAFAEQANALLTEDYRDEFKLPTIS